MASRPRLTLADLAPGRSNVVDLIMNQGRIAAESAQRSGETWGNTIANLSQMAGQGINRIAENRDNAAVQRAIQTAQSPYPSATQPKPTMGPDGSPVAEEPDYGIDHMDAILSSLPEQLRPRVIEGIQKADAAASVVQERRMRMAKLEQELEAHKREVSQSQADYIGGMAEDALPALRGPDGGLGVLKAVVAHAARTKVPGVEKYAQIVREADAAMQEAQASGDPAQIESVAENIRGMLGPKLQEFAQGQSAAARKVRAEAANALKPKTREVTIVNPDGSKSVRIVEDTPGQSFDSSVPPPEVGTFEDALRNKYGPRPTAEQTMRFRQQWEAAGRDPNAGLQKVETIENGKKVTKFVRPTAGATFEAPPDTAKPRATTGRERDVLGFYNRAKAASETALETEVKIAKYGVIDQGRLAIGGTAGNFLKNEDMQSYRQAQRAFTEARLRKESGASVKDSEYEQDERTYWAVPGDDDKTIEQKRIKREDVLEGLRIGSGKAYEEYFGEPAPRAANRPGAPKRLSAENADAEYAALPSGAQFFDPEGNLRTKP